jgi:hypothetical protein
MSPLDIVVTISSWAPERRAACLWLHPRGAKDGFILTGLYSSAKYQYLRLGSRKRIAGYAILYASDSVSSKGTEGRDGSELVCVARLGCDEAELCGRELERVLTEEYVFDVSLGLLV